MPLSFRFLFSFSVKVLLAYCGLRAGCRYGGCGEYRTWHTEVLVRTSMYVCTYVWSPFGLFSDGVSAAEGVSFEADVKVTKMVGL